jgi:hypothetical protein
VPSEEDFLPDLVRDALVNYFRVRGIPPSDEVLVTRWFQCTAFTLPTGADYLGMLEDNLPFQILRGKLLAESPDHRI